MKNVRKTQSKRTIGKKVIYEYNVSVKIEDYEVAREIVLAIKNA